MALGHVGHGATSGSLVQESLGVSASVLQAQGDIAHEAGIVALSQPGGL